MGLPAMTQLVKDPALPHLWHRVQMWLGFNSLAWKLPYSVGVAKKERKKRNQMRLNKRELSACQRLKVNFLKF